MTTARIELPPKIVEIFSQPRGSVRYRCAHGGRGSGKSFSFALMSAIWGYSEKLRILCTREFQSSIKESFYAEVKNAINSLPWLADQYEIGADFIRGKNGTEFIFRGLRHNMSSIKSMAQIDLAILEEAEDVPETSWRDLEPTIRAPKSELWCIWNPKKRNSPVDIRFIKNKHPEAVIKNLNYNDNPWFPDVLEKQRKYDSEIMSPELYNHIWNGDYLENSEATVFANKWIVKEFEPNPKRWSGAYFGCDFGFAVDPTTAVKSWIFEDCLYIEKEAFKVGLELDDTANYFKNHIEDIEKHVIYADCARPESISYLKRKGLPRIEACTKGKGSVEDGIEFLKRFRKIIIHPRCTNAAREFSLYSYKVDAHSGDILPAIVDDENHILDALRYSMFPIMKKSRIDYSKLI